MGSIRAEAYFVVASDHNQAVIDSQLALEDIAAAVALQQALLNKEAEPRITPAAAFQHHQRTLDLIEAVITRYPVEPPLWAHRLVDTALQLDDLMAELAR